MVLPIQYPTHYGIQVYQFLICNNTLFVNIEYVQDTSS